MAGGGVNCGFRGQKRQDWQMYLDTCLTVAHFGHGSNACFLLVPTFPLLSLDFLWGKL